MQTILDQILIRAAIGMTISSILILIGGFAEYSYDALKRDVLNLPLPEPGSDESGHRNTILVMQRKSEILIIVWGITFLPAFSGLFLTTGILNDDVIDLLFFVITIIVVGLPTGLGRVLWNRSFWREQLDPVRGIEEQLEKHFAVQIKHRPKSKSSRKWYSEVDMNIDTNYETMMRLSLRHLLLELISQRNASHDDRDRILISLSKRDDLIGQISRDVQKGVPQRAVINP
jgi:hypothetical protein